MANKILTAQEFQDECRAIWRQNCEANGIDPDKLLLVSTGLGIQVIERKPQR